MKRTNAVRRNDGFYMLETTGDEVPELVYDHTKMDEVLPMVWFHDGMVRVLRREYVRNAIVFWDQVASLRALDRDWLQKHETIFSWSQCTVIDAKDFQGVMRYLSVNTHE